LAKVLEGELAQRAEKTHRLRELQKQLMLLGGMVPPSPVVFSAARGASVAGAPATPVVGGGSQEALLGRKHRLEEDIEHHNEAIKVLVWAFQPGLCKLLAASIAAAPPSSCAPASRRPLACPRAPPPRRQQELQLQWERARHDEEGRGGGAADVKRWTGIRTVVEGRELLRTLFKVASDNKASVRGGLRGPWLRMVLMDACVTRPGTVPSDRTHLRQPRHSTPNQVTTERAPTPNSITAPKPSTPQLNEAHMELAKLCEEMDILRIMLDTAQQQAGEARRKAVETEATALAVISSTPLVTMDRLGLSSGGADARVGAGVDRTLRDADELIKELGIKLARLSAAADEDDGGAASAGEEGERVTGGGGGKGAGGGKDISKLFSMLGHLENDWEVFMHRDGAPRRSGGHLPPTDEAEAQHAPGGAPACDLPRPQPSPPPQEPPPQQQQPSGQQPPEDGPDGPEETDKAEIAEVVKSLDFDAAAASAASAAAAPSDSGAGASAEGSGEDFHDAEEGEEDSGWGDDGASASGSSSGTGGGDDSGSGIGESEEPGDDENDEDYVPTPAAPRRTQARGGAKPASKQGADGGGKARRRGGRRRGGGAGSGGESGAEAGGAALGAGPCRLGSPPGGCSRSWGPVSCRCDCKCTTGGSGTEAPASCSYRQTWVTPHPPAANDAAPCCTGSPGAAGRGGPAAPDGRRDLAKAHGFKRAESQRRRVLYHAWTTPVLQDVSPPATLMAWVSGPDSQAARLACKPRGCCLPGDGQPAGGPAPLHNTRVNPLPARWQFKPTEPKPAIFKPYQSPPTPPPSQINEVRAKKGAPPVKKLTLQVRPPTRHGCSSGGHLRRHRGVSPLSVLQ
jgi:hypothetical protein